MNCPICGMETSPLDNGPCWFCFYKSNIVHSGLEKIEPLSMVYTGYTENGISYCTGSRPADNRELMTKLNEVIERQNRIIDYLNEMVKK
jgi:hypothetical protein